MCTAVSTRAVCDELVKFAATVKIGRGTEDGVDIGPIQNRAQYDLVRAMVDEAINARREGAVPEPRASHGPGLFLPITILTDVTPDDACREGKRSSGRC